MSCVKSPSSCPALNPLVSSYIMEHGGGYNTRVRVDSGALPCRLLCMSVSIAEEPVIGLLDMVTSSGGLEIASLPFNSQNYNSRSQGFFPLTLVEGGTSVFFEI